MPQNVKNLFILLTALAIAMACAPIAAAPLPTLEPGAVNTIIVQTANAADSQTAAALPTSTATETSTPTPRATETPSPTPTVTFVFILPAIGGTSISPAPGGGNITNGTANSDYGCEVLSVEPAKGTVFPPRTDFVAKWGVKNIGRQDWFRATTKYVYVSGDKLHKVSSYSIPKGAETGKNVFLTVDMEAFKDKGSYQTTWALLVDNRYFCPLTLSIIVQ